MSDEIQKMIDDINGKNFSTANKTFTDLLNAKLADSLEQEKVAIASSIYGDEGEYEEEIEGALEDDNEGEDFTNEEDAED